ncbi:hypothetical protein DFJ73DRAFT_927398 [Zopfochytrium polystomum]|nr:hypothetical protein DFJ73DRAFT_927398 [Zopfochytrium polystomum]
MHHRCYIHSIYTSVNPTGTASPCTFHTLLIMRRQIIALLAYTTIAIAMACAATAANPEAGHLGYIVRLARRRTQGRPPSPPSPKPPPRRQQHQPPAHLVTDEVPPRVNGPAPPFVRPNSPQRPAQRPAQNGPTHEIIRPIPIRIGQQRPQQRQQQ